MKIERRYKYAFGLLLLFIVWTIVIKFVDTAPIGPNESIVGLSHINGPFHEMFGYQELICRVSEIGGYAGLALAGVLALSGLVQLIKCRKFSLVDKKLIALGVIYVLVLFLYVLFDKVAINYRPIIMPGETELEPSYPSTHTMLAIAIYGTAPILIHDYIRNDTLSGALIVACWMLMVITVIARLFAGVHWLTDIVGGILLASCLVLLYRAVCHRIDVMRKKEKRMKK